MRALLLYPRFPKTIESYEKVLKLINRKASMPPLGLVTVAAILPQTWEFKLVDHNVREVTEAEWDWAEVIIMSAMIVQKPDLLALIKEAKQRGKSVAVGGPYPTSIPQDSSGAGADYLILDEGEVTLPLFVNAIERGESQGVFRSEGERPDVTHTPVPRYDLLDLDAYNAMCVQFSRGCPFQCEFCDIIVLYGRKPRTKTPQQLLAELECLYQLGWRRSIFMVDDNFIGNKRNVKLMLQELQGWMAERQYPFTFLTEASVDLAQDTELMDSMVACNFKAVFLGIETPDEESLKLTKKFQNMRSSLVDAVRDINRTGLRVTAGFIIGFDGEKKGAGDRIIEFVEQTAIPTTTFGILQALPDTALWHRLKKEGRLLEILGDGSQTMLMNFIPTRPVEEIAEEYLRAFCTLYEPKCYLDRVYRSFRQMTAPPRLAPNKFPGLIELKALAYIVWQQGIKRNTRFMFWHHLFSILKHNPTVWDQYLTVCAYAEHFVEFRDLVREQMDAQLTKFKVEETRRDLEKKDLENALLSK